MNGSLSSVLGCVHTGHHGPTMYVTGPGEGGGVSVMADKAVTMREHIIPPHGFLMA